MDAVEFAVRDASRWETREDEPMGTKRKVWLEDPERVPYLFKYVRQDSSGGAYGDDWAEKLAAELARLLGMPAADVDLARRNGDPGVLCRRINDPERVDLVHGNELLSGREPRYDRDLKREHPLYTVEAVRSGLADTEAPPDSGSAERLTGFGVWSGYLVFDAWTANTDRHHENWAVLLDQRDRRARLSPSFDHGSSLGFNVPAPQMDEMASDPVRLRRWCGKGRSSHFAGRPTLVAVAVEALAAAGTDSRVHWLSNLARLRPEEWNRIIGRIPDARMSVEARRFVSAVLDVNRRRLLDACDWPT